jgi:hypothetical protein
VHELTEKLKKAPYSWDKQDKIITEWLEEKCNNIPFNNCGVSGYQKVLDHFGLTKKSCKCGYSMKKAYVKEEKTEEEDWNFCPQCGEKLE